jgi:hypothetical protein
MKEGGAGVAEVRARWGEGVRRNASQERGDL